MKINRKELQRAIYQLNGLVIDYGPKEISRSVFEMVKIERASKKKKKTAISKKSQPSISEDCLVATAKVFQ